MYTKISIQGKEYFIKDTNDKAGNKTLYNEKAQVIGCWYCLNNTVVLLKDNNLFETLEQTIKRIKNEL